MEKVNVQFWQKIVVIRLKFSADKKYVAQH